MWWCVCAWAVFVRGFADGVADLRLKGELDVQTPATDADWLRDLV